jgi:hypothetical protein
MLGRRRRSSVQLFRIEWVTGMVLAEWAPAIDQPLLGFAFCVDHLEVQSVLRAGFPRTRYSVAAHQGTSASAIAPAVPQEPVCVPFPTFCVWLPTGVLFGA